MNGQRAGDGMRRGSPEHGLTGLCAEMAAGAVEHASRARPEMRLSLEDWFELEVQITASLEWRFGHLFADNLVKEAILTADERHIALMAANPERRRAFYSERQARFAAAAAGEPAA
jgi:hypothetical protein